MKSDAKPFTIQMCTFSHFSEKEFKHRSSRQTHVCHGLHAKQKQKQRTSDKKKKTKAHRQRETAVATIRNSRSEAQR